MKIHRLLAAALAALTFCIAAAQENSEIAALKAKAEKGNGIAQFNLGLAYAQGRLTAADPVEAFVWLSLARENGTRDRTLDNLVAALDKATLETAKQRLAERRATLAARAPVPAAFIVSRDGIIRFVYSNDDPLHPIDMDDLLVAAKAAAVQ